MIAAAHDHAAHKAEDQYAEQHTHQADIQAHVTVQDVAEFVRDDTLQFVAVQ